MAKKDSARKKAAEPPSLPLGRNGLVAIGIGIAVIIVIVAALWLTGGGSVAAVPREECGRQVISYLNENVVQEGTAVQLLSSSEQNGVYRLETTYQGRNVTIYSSKDCSLLFTTTYNMKEVATPTPTTSPTPAASPTPTPAPVKTGKPATELYVMSFCPYGVQAETAMEPVTKLLGSKADIRLRYIATVTGDTLDSVNSLHGPVEAKEDVRQLCIAKYYPAKLWPYLKDFNANCYSLLKNASGLSTCVISATQKAGIDNAKIEACATGSEGLALLKADTAVTTANGVSGSPTLIINGQRYTGARTPEAYKQAICARFTTPPAECSTNLSATTAAASGTCG